METFPATCKQLNKKILMHGKTAVNKQNIYLKPKQEIQSMWHNKEFFRKTLNINDLIFSH